MNIKVLCSCGQKYAFEVDPVNGRMPAPVACPICGTDGTAQANDLIAQARPPGTAPVPVANSTVRVAPAQLPPPPPAPPVTPSPGRRPGAPTGSRDPSPRGTRLGLTSWIWIALVIGLALYGFGRKWSRRARVAGELAAVLKAAASMDGGVEWTLPDDDGVKLLVKTTNDTAVAQACVTFWQTRQQPALVARRDTTGTHFEHALMVVHSPHDGVVQVDGPIFWDEASEALFTGLAQTLSRTFNTTSACALMGDDAEGGLFALYERGSKVFGCDRQIYIHNGDIQEVVKVEGQTWAAGSGYKPREGSWEKFTMYDADGLVQHLGFKPLPSDASETVTVLADASRQ